MKVGYSYSNLISMGIYGFYMDFILIVNERIVKLHTHTNTQHTPTRARAHAHTHTHTHTHSHINTHTLTGTTKLTLIRSRSGQVTGLRFLS